MKKIDLHKMGKELYPNCGYKNIKAIEELTNELWNANSHFNLNSTCLIKKLGLIMYENVKESSVETKNCEFEGLVLVLNRKKELIQLIKQKISEIESEIVEHEEKIGGYKSEIKKTTL